MPSERIYRQIFYFRDKSEHFAKKTLPITIVDTFPHAPAYMRVQVGNKDPDRLRQSLNSPLHRLTSGGMVASEMAEFPYFTLAPA